MSVDDYRALARFRYLIRQFLKASEHLADDRGLTPQQYQALVALAGRDPDDLPTVGYLAERLMIKHHSAVGLADRLEAQGLVRRETNPGDRRQVLLRLTDHGVALLADLASSHRRELRSLAPHLVIALAEIARETGDDVV
ncbi:MAG TPA: MarR family transcriptional regulator [Thermomicrobiaceae bacterium]|nr:MarR family transcriptional regulator [Thermomicrobiaceae bacterium]